MPDPSQILSGLHTIANSTRDLAIGWHVVGWLVAARIALGWRPQRRGVAMVLGLPLLSVAALAWKHGNPFNGVVLSAAAIVLVGLGSKLPKTPTDRAVPWARAIGGAMMIYGLIYPHFLDARSSLEYLYAAPTGLVPCPTLSFVIGVALALDGLGSRVWSLALAGIGLFYAVFGILRLGVLLDLGLLAGVVALVVLVLGRKDNRARDW